MAMSGTAVEMVAIKTICAAESEASAADVVGKAEGIAVWFLDFSHR